MSLTEGESKALVASSILVLLSVLGRLMLQPPPAQVQLRGVRGAGDADSALAAAESIRAQVDRRDAALAPGERIDPNSADEVELDRLPGIGPSLARAIVLNRQQEGPFRSLVELERVPGLGSTKVERLGPYVTLPRTGLPRSARRAEDVEGAARRTIGGRPRSRVDLNRATQAELEALPGIGPARAQAIVRWREEHGSFQELEDLLRVPGIGPATLDGLRSLVVAGP